MKLFFSSLNIKIYSLIFCKINERIFTPVNSLKEVLIMYSLEPLPYGYDALEPYISVDMLRLHHDKHHQAYVDKLNSAIKGATLESSTDVACLLTDLHSIPENLRKAVKNQGGGHYNHTLYWNILGNAKNNHDPIGKVASEIKNTFGDFDTFKEKFNQLAITLFGSGWVWLIVDQNKSFKLVQTPNQDCPLSDGAFPLLTMDVWEHAYYYQYQNRRPEYVKQFWNVVNWSSVEERYQQYLDK